MNKKKKLPKAIVWTADKAGEAGSETGAAQSSPVPSNVIEMMPKAETPSADAAPTPRAADSAEAAERRRRARAIVERHANLSAVGGVIPMPLLNIAGVTAIIVRMVRSLSRLYGVRYERNRARTLVIALMGGSMPTGLASAAASALIYFVPGYNLLGLAVSSVTASATARGIGQMLIEHFEGGSTLADFPALRVR